MFKHLYELRYGIGSHGPKPFTIDITMADKGFMPDCKLLSLDEIGIAVGTSGSDERVHLIPWTSIRHIAVTC